MAYIRLNSVSVGLPVNDGAMRRLIKLPNFPRAKIGSAVVSQRSRAMVVCALNNIGLELNDGDRLCLVCLNGTGKTTLLRECLSLLSRVFLEDTDEAFDRHTNIRRGAGA